MLPDITLVTISVFACLCCDEVATDWNMISKVFGFLVCGLIKLMHRSSFHVISKPISM